MRTLRRKLLGAVALAAALPTFVVGAVAQEAWPSKPITMVIPYAAGGPMDIMGRVIVDKLSAELGQNVLIEAQPGASGTIGAHYVANAEPDGYTILFSSAPTLTVLKATRGDTLSFDPITDLQPVMVLSSRPFVLFVDPALGFETAAEFIEAAKNNPDKYTYSSSGVGGQEFLLTEHLKHLTGADLLHIPYAGGGPAIQAVESGEVSMFFGGLSQHKQFGATGRVKALGVTSPESVSQAPELPPLGIPGLEMYAGMDFFAPPGTPTEVVDRLRDALTKAIQHPDVLPIVLDSGELSDASPEEMTAQMTRDYETLTNLIEVTSLELDL